MDARFGTELIRLDGEAVVRVVGDIDTATSPALLEACVEMGSVADRLVLDVGGVTFMDCAGLHVLIATRERMGAGRIVVRNASDQVRRLLAITGLTEQFLEQP